ncbi:hypothetical protein 10RS306A_gene4598 [Ralstonia phage 10RS306A]|uniref:Uncharacterized protein n=1 Tax=Ralstonia phage 10RS306A TaxID=2968818 RepID=A0A977TEM6_9CAUD|nr:hypothetical protein 10RS306A_gene4598 [Ralstonia phage 10RS306A]UYE93700.1 hypothetical protein 10RS305A_4601 [Ralstonia phage 10RS305A]
MPRSYQLNVSTRVKVVVPDSELPEVMKAFEELKGLAAQLRLLVEREDVPKLRSMFARNSDIPDSAVLKIARGRLRAFANIGEDLDAFILFSIKLNLKDQFKDNLDGDTTLTFSPPKFETVKVYGQ